MTLAPRARAVLAGLLLGILALLAGPATPAAAHANLLSSNPADGAILTDPPSVVQLTFSEPVRLVPDRVIVVAPDGQRVSIGEPAASGAEVTIPLGEVSARGTYLVSYRVISADSHPVSGAITFSIGAPSETPEVPAGQGDPDDPVVKTAMSVGKYLGYAGLALLIGSAVMLSLLWPERLSRRGVARLLWAGLGTTAFATLVTLWVQVPYSTGSALFAFDEAAVRQVLGSTYGAAHVIRLGILAAVALLLGPLLAGQASRVDRIVLVGLGLVGLGTWPVAGHPLASPIPAVSIAVNTVHLAAAAFWLGGLVILAGFLLRLANPRELSVILPAWSRWAALAVTWLLLAGLILALIEVGSPSALFSTTYGRLVLVKAGLVLVVIAVAAFSRHLVRYNLQSERPRAMRTAVVAEALVLAGVLGLSSVLVQTTPARTAVTEAEQVTGGDFIATLTSELYSLEVFVSPARLGNNSLHLYAYDPASGQPLPVEEWAATAALPAAGVEPIDVSVLKITDNHAIGEVSLPIAGDWEMRFTLRVSEIDQASVTATVPIS